MIAQKSKLRLTPEVIAALASQGRDHRLTASGFFPCSIDREYLRMDIARHSGCALSHNGNPALVHRQRGTKVFFHQALQDRKLLPIPHIHCFDAHRLRAHYRLRSSNFILAPAILQDLKGQGTQSKIPPRMKNETPRMLRPMRKRLWQKSLGVRLSRTRQMTPPKTRSPEPPTSWKP